MIIGLTGPTGAGKTTAARILEGMGCDIIDCDVLARDITLPGSPVLAELAQRFGEDIVREDGFLDRALLASRAFASEQARQALNAITHPAITALALEQAGRSDGRAVVIDAAALLESELIWYCNHTIVVTAPEELRLARILARDGITEQAARQRMAAQSHINYHRYGHTIIDTSDGEAALKRELEKILAEILPMGGDPPAGPGPADRHMFPQGD